MSEWEPGQSGSGSRIGGATMIWLCLIGGLHILGFGFTLTRLAYDEWQRSSRMTPAAKEDRPREVEYATWKTATT